MKKSALVIIAMSTIIAGFPFVPEFTSADNSLHLGLGTNAISQSKDKDRDRKESDRQLNIKDKSLISETKTARMIFNNAVKDANTTYRTAKKTAKTQFKTSVREATNQTARIDALKTYSSSILAAFKVKSSAVETASQVFIDTHFPNQANGLHLGFGINAISQSSDWQLNIKDESLISATKTARIIFNNAVEDASTAYRTSEKMAKNQFKTSVREATNQTARIDALKTYFSSILAAFKVKSSAIETAFQVFIDTQFPNQAPTANEQNVTLMKNSSVNIILTGSDPEGSTLTYIVVTTPANGVISGTAPNLTYTPTINFTGTDSFTFKVNDGGLNSTLKTVSITVNQ